jgi:2-methylcitrate dehydratase PrpD
MAEDTRTPREPWAGYAALSEADRKDQLQKRVQDALDTGDQPYALALSAAAVNYELALKLHPDETHSEPVAEAARKLHDNAGSWQGS